ncbi:transcription factor CP2-like protein 1 isoform X1 [Nelusetta ayraudi]|uniref:transcription factor CP2-like protein 1 isoform X1 n=1 Tax=Nelusetta ayraudi TaxID=303726 RepID=UPI003F6EAC20
MLFCHSQPESYHQQHQQQHQQQQQQQHQQHSAGYIREALAPFLKSEEARLLAEHGAAARSPFTYVLCAATSPAVRQQDESLTYLNQGQSYEIRLLNKKLLDHTDISSKYVKSIVRVVFHDRRLQYMEHQQLEGWRWNRPGDRILDLDIPLSVGIVEPCSHPLHLNTIEFLWEPAKTASVFIQVNCISTEFTPRKHGGEKGVPFRIQVDTFTTNQRGDYVEHVHSSSCQVKVFKPKGADRKLKTDREKMEKKSLQDKDKYQLSHETTLLRECSPWPDSLAVATHGSSSSSSSSSSSNSSSSSSSNSSSSSSTPPPVYHSSPPSCTFTDGNCSPDQQDAPLAGCSDHLLPSSSPQDTQQWLQQHRFSPFSRLLFSFSGADLLRMSREDLIQICGPADGIRLFNTLKGRCLQPRLTIYVCQQQARRQPHLKPGGGDIYRALYLEEPTLLDLCEKIATLYSIAPQQITHIYWQKADGIHVLVCDEVVQSFKEETSFILSTIRDESTDGYHVMLK